MGSWQVQTSTPISMLHLIGPATARVEETGLVYLAGDDAGIPRLYRLVKGEIKVVESFSQPTLMTGLVGIPSQPVIAFSTLTPAGDQGNELQSTLYLANVLPDYSSRIILKIKREDSRYLQPVAIHAGPNGEPDGLWYTTNLWGIGGDMLTNERAGLFFLDLQKKTSVEVLSEGCTFSSLISGQSWASWSDEKGVHAANLHSGEKVTYTASPGMDRRPAAAILSPMESYLVWLEGSGWQYDEGFRHTIQLGSLNGIVRAEYSPETFKEAAGMGEEFLVQPIGWTFPDNECLLVLATDQDSNQAALLQLDTISGEVSRLTEAIPIGFGYP
jgi:hypothetical protein